VIDAANEFLAKNVQVADLLVRKYQSLAKPLLLRADVVDVADEFCSSEEGAAMHGSPFHDVLRAAQEAVIRDQGISLAVRWSIARWSYLELSADDLHLHTVSTAEFLRTKEGVSRNGEPAEALLEIDLKPFERGFPRLREMRSIGHGVEYLNRYLSSRLFQELDSGGHQLLQFLRMHHVRGMPLMLNDRITDLEPLREALRRADAFLARQPAQRPCTELAGELAQMGFEPGWGRTVERTRETMDFLMDILEAPAPESVARFLGRIPMIFTIAIVSPHGYFGQADVLGKPDTGGQVVYILDQVRALERSMHDFLERQGLEIEPCILVMTRLIPEAEGTTCDQRLEPIHGTRNARILRVPFRDEQGQVVPHWISRFQIWPYLERFARDAHREFMQEVGQKPDFIIGNYSDGNLVASLLAHQLGVTQCNIAHALEKTKYLYSDLYWKDHEGSHNFACQYTADLIAMNTADFVITSTYQEIAGTADSIGQYESYQAYTLPDLYRVLYGIDVFDPKFNVVSPGADPNVFFPASDQARRDAEVCQHVAELVYGQRSSQGRGHLVQADKPLLLAMSRLDYVKNPAGLVQWFGQHPVLRQHANLLLVGGVLEPHLSSDAEERDQIEKIHGLIDQFALDGHLRWVVMQTDKRVVGELYRLVADRRGAFVQPALFEAFGLTVIEAMSTGLPTFATRYGGPLETIEDEVSGFHIDPNNGAEAAEKMLGFLVRCHEEPEYWDRVSRGALDRVATHYTWQLYAERLLRLARIYGFWKYFSNIEREETRRYLEMLYFLAYRPMAADVARRAAN
jgi:sucrose synthase